MRIILRGVPNHSDATSGGEAAAPAAPSEGWGGDLVLCSLHGLDHTAVTALTSEPWYTSSCCSTARSARGS